MQMTIPNDITKLNNLTKSDNRKYIVLMCFLLVILILGRATNNAFFYIFVGVSLMIFTLSSVMDCFLLLLFLLPFAPILKVNPGQMSFFTILFFIVVLRMVIAKKSFHTNVVLLLILFTIYCIAFSGLSKIATIITIIAGMIMLYYLRTTQVNVTSVIIAFSSGIIGASVLVLVKDLFPIMNTFIVDAVIKFDSGSYTNRFAAFQGNPNYYTLDISIILSAIIAVMYYKHARYLYMYLIILSIFGLMSVSKSFLLSLILLMFLWFILSLRQGIKKVTKLLIILVVSGVLVYLCAYDYINAYLFRFAKDNQASLSGITTGRADIWELYIGEIFNNVKIFLFGNGLNTVIEGGRAAHNTYLESLFSLGILGTGLFLSCLRACMGKIIIKPVMWIPIVILLFRMMAIGNLTYDNLWFELAIIVSLGKVVNAEELEKL